MPIVFVQNRGGKVGIRATANEFYVVAGNSSVSNLFAPSDVTIIEPNLPYVQNTITINDAHIISLSWSTNNVIQVWRGAQNNTSQANGTLVWSLNQTGTIDLRAMGIAANNANDFPAANLSFVFASNSTVLSSGTLLIVLAKDTSYVGEY